MQVARKCLKCCWIKLENEKDCGWCGADWCEETTLIFSQFDEYKEFRTTLYEWRLDKPDNVFEAAVEKQKQDIGMRLL